MKNPQQFIDNAKQASETTYRDGVAEDRLAFRVGMLEAYIKGLCDIINEYEKEIDKAAERFIR
jgi:hypothetical protein